MDSEQPELWHFADNERGFQRATWAAFDEATTDDQARAAFEKRYGRRPAVVKRSGPVVLAGPIPERGGDK